MGTIFEAIYRWLDDFFGTELAEYLSGHTSFLQQSNMYIGIGLTMLAISLAMAVLYYYVINHPKLGNWWGWLIFLTINAAINFVVGWQWVLSGYEEMMITINLRTGMTERLLIFRPDIVAFGVVNMIDSIIAFIIFSFTIKWWSVNCRNAPF